MLRIPPKIAATAALLSLMVAVTAVPKVALAETATVASATELRQEPNLDSAILLVIPTGGALGLDGPPLGDFYPVIFDGTSGWIPAASLVISKDGLTDGSTVVGESDPIDDFVSSPDETAPLGPVEGVQDPTVEALQPTAVAVETTAIPVLSTEPVEIPPVEAAPAIDANEQPTEPAAPVAPETPSPMAASEAPVTTSVPTAVSEGTSESLPFDPSPEPTIVSEATVVPVPEIEPTLAPTVGPSATPLAPLTGPATATQDAALRAGPDDRSTFLFSVSTGSTVVRTGRFINGWVSADYMGIVGWVRADQLAEPLPDEPEPTPTPAPGTALTEEPGATGVGGPTSIDQEPTRPARPGTGRAFALTDVTLRAGPRSTYEEVDLIPAGAAVVLTGVMENGFVRVERSGQVGWVAFDLLSHPTSPTPATSPRGTDSRRVYSRQEIVQVIYAAADRYGQPRADMLRVARCESDLLPYAVNASGSYGLFQFISSTWQSTPYADENIFDPEANANAAGWMWAEGRRSEWVCQ